MSTWTPIESNPDVLTKFIHKLGVPKEWILTDVVGLDDDMLEFMPHPIKALILLFPDSEAYLSYQKKEDDRLRAMPQEYGPELFFMRQVTHNACGTVSLIHSLANNRDIKLAKDSVLSNFLNKVENLTPQERGKALDEDEEFAKQHQELAKEGQTDANDDNVIYHFTALVNCNGGLYELDGTRPRPIKHGATSEESFLRDAAKICKQFMSRDPDDMHFTVLALAPTLD